MVQLKNKTALNLIMYKIMLHGFVYNFLYFLNHNKVINCDKYEKLRRGNNVKYV